MLKRVGVGMLVVLLLVASTFSAVAAQGPEPPEDAPQRGPMGRRAPRIFLQVRAILGKVADALQLTGEELREALASGQTVAEVAEEEGVPLDDVTGAVMEDIEARLEQFFVEGVPPQFGPGGMRQARGLALDVVAETLGMEEEAVAEALRDGETVADLATDAGVPLDDVVDALLAEAESHLDQAVEDGRLTQDEADERLADLEPRLEEILTEPLPAQFGRGRMHRVRMLALDVVAEMLGMEEDAVREALRDGETVADLAADAGVPLDDVVDALLAEAEERLAEAVADGRLTQDEAEEHLERLEERLREHLETPLQDRRPSMPMRGGGRGRDRGVEDGCQMSGPRF